MSVIEKCLPSTQDKIIEISRENVNRNILLSNNICERYDVLNYKKKIKQLFKRLLEKRYLNPEEDINITTNYEINPYRNTSCNTMSSVEKSVDSYIDAILYENEVCKKLLVLADKFTSEEGIYFVYTFLFKKSEDEIADILRISRTTLQKIKKSCIVKAWFELKIFCENE